MFPLAGCIEPPAPRVPGAIPPHLIWNVMNSEPVGGDPNVIVTYYFTWVQQTDQVSLGGAAGRHIPPRPTRVASKAAQPRGRPLRLQADGQKFDLVSV